jgi:hypothetical protein
MFKFKLVYILIPFFYVFGIEQKFELEYYPIQYLNTTNKEICSQECDMLSGKEFEMLHVYI